MTRTIAGWASVTIAVFFSLTATAANPFSAFSSQWDLPYFAEAGVNNHTPQLSSLEKEFMHALNLARMSPVLFVSTVFEPWCMKSKPNPFPYDRISQLYNTSNLKVISTDAFLLSLAGTFLPRLVSENTKGSDSLLLQRIRPVSRYLLATGEEQGALGLLLHLMAGQDGEGSIFNDLFFSNHPLAGLKIRNEGEGKQSLLMFSCSAAEHETLLDNNGMINLSPTLRIAIDYVSDEPLASFMKELKNGAFGPGNAVVPGFQLSPAAEYMGPREFMYLKDSLEENGILHQVNLLNFSLISDTSAAEIHSAREFVPEDWKYMPSGFMEPDAATEKFMIHRAIDVQKGSSEIKLVTLSVPPPLPYLPADSIGVHLPDVDFSATDLAARTLDAPTPDLLVKKLLLKQTTELQKVRSIFMWMVSHLRYDDEGLAAGTPAVEIGEIWQKRVAICSGYARLFIHLCKLAGIHAVKISGISGGAEPGRHAWNAVRIGGRYYLLDATWGEAYFLRAPGEFLEDHYPCVKRWALLNSLPPFGDWLQPSTTEGNNSQNQP